MRTDKMNPHLIEIEKLVIQIERFLKPDLSLDVPSAEELWRERMEKRDWISDVLNSALEKFYNIAPSLNPEEVIFGYKNGSKVLQEMLSGLMKTPEFLSEKYIPVMIEAINNDGPSPLYGFLLRLSERLSNEEIEPLILKGLESQHVTMRDTALRLASKMKIKQAVPIIQKMVNDPHPAIVSNSKRVIEEMKNW